MSQPLPRYLEQPDFDQKLAQILIAVGEPAPPDRTYRATAAGDERKLRGIPCIARGVAGKTSADHVNDPRSSPFRLRAVR